MYILSLEIHALEVMGISKWGRSWWVCDGTGWRAVDL